MGHAGNFLFCWNKNLKIKEVIISHNDQSSLKCFKNLDVKYGFINYDLVKAIYLIILVSVVFLPTGFICQGKK